MPTFSGLLWLMQTYIAGEFQFCSQITCPTRGYSRGKLRLSGQRKMIPADIVSRRCSKMLNMITVLSYL